MGFAYRLLASFSAYHHTQTALRMHQWMSNGSVFCMLCGKMNQNPSTLIKHVSSEHSICCRVVFASKDQLSAHLLQHHGKQCSTGEEQHLKEFKNQVNNGFNRSLDPQNISLQSNCRKSYSYRKKCIREAQSKYEFHCDMCSMVFSRRFELRRHKIMCHSEQHSDKENSVNKRVNISMEKNENMCANESQDNCDGSARSDVEDVMNFSEESVNSEDISRHLDVSTNSLSQVRCQVENEDQSFSCLICEFVCTKRQEMLSHRRKEHSLKEQKMSLQKTVTCCLCQNSYSRSSDLQRHILKKHGGEKFGGRCVDSVDDMSVEVINRAKQDINGTIVYQCDICDKNMLTKRGFVRHVRIHRDERPFTCHVCGRQYRSHPDLTRHLRSVHDKVKNYPCDICGRSFANKGTRDDHRRTHTGERPYMCHTCGKAFATANSIYVHRRTHSDYFAHHCTTCSKKFRRRQQLTHHLRTHTGEKPHACDVCGKSFAVKDEVTRHRQTHSNDKPHTCPLCGICFGQKRYLTNHMKTHHSRAL